MRSPTSNAGSSNSGSIAKASKRQSRDMQIHDTRSARPRPRRRESSFASEGSYDSRSSSRESSDGKNSVKKNGENGERQLTKAELEQKEKEEIVDELIFDMNDVANDGQDLAMQLRELISDQPAVSSLVQDLASSLSTFGRTLRELALYLGTPAAPFAFVATEVVQTSLDYAEDLFDQVDDMMYKFEKDPDHDFIYCFKDTTVLTLSSKLESSRLTLAVILQVMQLRALMNLQEMEDGDDKALRHRIKDLRLEAQSMVLDETWARRKEKLLEDNNIADAANSDQPIMPRHTMTEAAAAVTVLLDNLTVPYRPTNDQRVSMQERQKLSTSDQRGLPEDCPPDGSHEKRDKLMETIAKAALAAGVLGIWKSRSKVPLPKQVKERKDKMKQKATPKHGASILSGLGGKIEAIAPVALAAGAYEVFKNRNNHENKKEKAKRFMNATRGAAFGAVAA